jgi:beta-glucosidase
MSTFPKGFIWGAACASYQCEGAWNIDGKGPSVWDDFSHTPGCVLNGETGDTACDVYHRYEEDIALTADLGIPNYRFSVSWPRIFPLGTGTANQKGLDFYDCYVDALLEKGIEPWVTLYHWDLPSALQQLGGWMNRDIVDAFAAYTDVLSRMFGARVKNYITVNEPQCFITLGYGRGEHAPGLKLSSVELLKGSHHVALAHSAAQEILRANAPVGTRVGLATTGQLCYPVVDTPEAYKQAMRRSFDMSAPGWDFTHSLFLDGIILKRFDDTLPETLKRFVDTLPAADFERMCAPDFLGLNFYNGTPVDADGTAVSFPPGFPKTACRWAVTPEGLYYGVKQLYERYGLPIIITENGQSCNDRIYLDGQVHDLDRIDYLHRYLLQLKRAIDEKIPVEGYLQWSLLDNFEWALGYNERFGLVYVDYTTQQRIPKDSARWFSNVIRTNGAEL